MNLNEQLRLRLGGIVDSLRDAIVSVDSQQKIILFNPAAEAMFGCPEKDALGRPLDSFIVGFKLDQHHSAKPASKTAHEAPAFDTLRGRRAHGQEFPIEASISQSQVAGQNVCTLILRDITGRRKSEEATAMLAAIVDSSEDAIVSKDLNSIVTSWNAGAERLFGYTAAEMIGRSITQIIPPERQHEEVEIQAQIRRGEHVGHFETLRLTKGRNTIAVSLSVSPILNREGRIVGASKVARDITRLRQREAALRQSEARFVKAFQANPAAMCITTIQEGRFIEVNERYCQLFNLSREELIGRTSVELELWDDPPTRTAVMEQLQAEGAVRDREARFRPRNRGWVDALVSMELIEFPGENDSVVISMFADITEHKRAKAALQDSEERFRTMANSIPQLAWIAQPDGHIFWYNQRWYEYTGTTPEEMEGWGWQAVHDPGVLPRVLGEWKAALAAGRTFEMEFPLRGADGRFRRFLTRVQPLKDASGRLIQWFGTNTDVESMKQAEERIQHLNADLEQRVIERTAQFETANHELSQSRAELKSLFESLPGLYLVLTPEFKIVAASDAYLAATMTTREGIVGRGLFEVFPDNPEDPAADGVYNLRASLDRVLANGVADTMAIQKYDVRRPDGVFEERYWSPINSPVVGADRKIQYIIHRVEEVTDFVRRRSQAAGRDAELSARMEQMEAEVFTSSQKVQAVNLQLEAANKELESFSYSVSHDLRAPLRAMDGFSRAVLEDYGKQLPPDGLRYLQVIRTSAQRMGHLIDDLLSFSRLSRAALSKRTVDVRRLVQDALEELQTMREGRQIDLRIGDLPPCEGDPTLLKQVWINLLSNALKYTQKRECAVVEIGCNPDRGRNVYHVRDNGTGFDMRYAHKLFGVFQRLHRAEDYDGTGVGLAIVQRVINRHGGRVWAEASVDQGATFYFTLEGDQPP
ncbi:MAG: PAS domain S-box protein [Verrucomicrobia bacterium]|nr:PAS domain S-box protein [Verrucomicrobiota bacterium]